MPKRVGKYPMAFRQMAVERMRHCGSVWALAQELGVDRTALYHWRRLQANAPFSTFFRLLTVCRTLRSQVS